MNENKLKVIQKDRLVWNKLCKKALGILSSRKMKDFAQIIV